MQTNLLSFLLLSLYKSLLIVLFSGVFLLLKNQVSARIRYVVWVTLLVSLILPFRPRIGQGIRLEETVSVVSTSGQTVATGTQEAAVHQSSMWDMLAGLPWGYILLGIWLIGFLVIIGRSIFSYLKFRNLLLRWGKPITDPQILESFHAIKAEFGIKKAIRLVHYPQVSSPMIFGLRNPVILLPDTNYTLEELDLIFEHELTHYRHRDIYVNLLVLLVKAAHWFNPIVHFACKEVQEAAECYCDHSVLHNRDETYRSFYGETIITMIHRSKQQPVLLSSCFYSNKFNLKRRIIAIMDSRLPKKYLTVLVSLVTLFSILFSGSIFVVAMGTTQDELVQMSQAEGLTKDQALALVTEQQKLKPSDLTDIQITIQDNQYHIQFKKGDTQYKALVDKATGDILTLEKETVRLVENSTTSSEQTTSSSVTTSVPSETSSQPVVQSVVDTATGEQQGATSTPVVNQQTPASTATQQIDTETDTDTDTDTSDTDADDADSDD
ncbi:M56 family metallopeptidase [Streptococcus oriscaviae]|uniref:M56 family metallopeptidase n=1 Tax=Streptococcus oriscaviae TaxID=2781599 RepID=A0ABX7YJZ1_9STRE|nr:M56 family metallopeptidase [Streptococcus oriscaviae]QUE53669.1 M56 family metallopeptidase [Streptococcus oriscaviae]